MAFEYFLKAEFILPQRGFSAFALMNLLLQLLILLHQLLLQGSNIQMGSDARQDFRLMQRLGQIINAPGGKAVDLILDAIERGDENDRYLVRLGVGFQAATSFEAVNFRHHHIQQNQVRLSKSGFLYSINAVAGNHHLKALSAQIAC